MKMMKSILIVSLSLLVVSPVFAHEGDTKTTQPKVVNMFGGEAYLGEPALGVTVALVEAGGGAENFSFSKALIAMLGEENVNAEVAKLTKQYGEGSVKTFITGMDYAVKQSLKRAKEAGIQLPEAADLSGVDLAKALINAGLDSDNIFWSGRLFDVALSHKLHNVVMVDINNNFGYEVDKLTHKMLNQAMYDVAMALKMTNVVLADLH